MLPLASSSWALRDSLYLTTPVTFANSVPHLVFLRACYGNFEEAYMMV
jgi:hypothetical protein